MTVNKKYCLLILLFTTLQSCWEKQHHEIVPPVTPVYSLSGTVRDIDSEELLSGIEINIGLKSVISDSMGKYEFNKTLEVGEHMIIAEREGYEVYQKTIVMTYKDRILDIKVPKVLLGIGVANTRTSSLKGICWKNSMVYILKHFKPSEEISHHTIEIYEMNFSGSSRLCSNLFEDLPEGFSCNGLEFYLGSYWFAISSTAQSYLYSITNAGVNSKLSLPTSVADIVRDGSRFWITNGRTKIVKLVDWGRVTKEYFAPGTSTGGIAWDGYNIWTTDTAANLIYKYDENMSVVTTYKPHVDRSINPDTLIYWITHIVFDASGNLWGIGHSKPEGIIVKFSIM